MWREEVFKADQFCEWMYAVGCAGERMQAQLQWWLSRESVAEQAAQSRVSYMYECVYTHVH